MTRKSSILWGGLSLLSLGYTVNRFLENDEISPLGTFGVFVGLAGILYNLYERNREQSKKTEDKPEKKKVKPGRTDEESVVPSETTEIVEVIPTTRPEAPTAEEEVTSTPESVGWNRQYWENRRINPDAYSQCFYRVMIGPGPEIGGLIGLLDGIQRRYPKATKEFTADDLGTTIWSQDLREQLRLMKEGLNYYLNTELPEIPDFSERNPGRKEFLEDVKGRVERIEKSYREVAGELTTLTEAYPDEDYKGLAINMLRSNHNLRRALESTKVHLTQHSSDSKNAFYKRTDGSYAGRKRGKRSRSNSPVQIFGFYTRVEKLAEEQGSIRSYIRGRLAAPRT